ncbi:MAG: rhomboid family intramembrane serine protease [Bacteroidales bacterium]|nr:rhomboid family intramembrane serine protease [Bacteroidales bacterium]
MDEKQERNKFFGSLAIPALLATLMLVVKVAEMAFSVDLGHWGLAPRTLKGLIGVLTMPLLHGSWEHLLANTPAILVLGTALYYCYPTLANRVMVFSWIASGLLTWIIGIPESVHVGASALIYSLNLFLILSGFIRGNRMLIVISLIMVFLYGSFIWGMIPSLAVPQHISWEGHLSGALVGTALALLYRKEGPQKEVYHWDEDEDEDDEDEKEPKGDASEATKDHPEEATKEKPYWDVPMPSNDELTVQYRFRR